MTVSDETLATVFSEHRGHLIGVAYRITGTRADAEDAVQDAWLRLAGLTAAARAEIRDLRAWLTTVVGRICLDRLKAASAQRERYVGSWLPEPVVSPLTTQPSEDPLDVAVREDGVRMAAMVVLHELSPEQRVAFVLHDAFGVPFPEIATALGVTPAAARQLASRARRAVTEADTPPRVELAEQRAVLERFTSALASGDMNALLAVLHPDVVVIGDSGGQARTARRPVVGADKVARFALGLLRQYGPESVRSGITPVLVNGDLGFLAQTDGGDGHRPVDRRVSTLAVRDGRIVAIYDVVNPAKLTNVAW
ncbi:sigma-70 family RNA polymerase sigma factor [Crossiella sp. CA-258035]|uniref:sigma-70 family RNA polymerase sigma factor n=1 Tax=Crossiella sp. CA-258035 TaxID=2981138 RepID=UPI0024BD0B16|nr:sigma-70 family RNA polymerase sigma factor [Crossiella sp. CA-258035]WHT20939.1 sigma-70 family RNA polymerase sigma factor [Crossiella sp. CA-258035]